LFTAVLANRSDRGRGAVLAAAETLNNVSILAVRYQGLAPPGLNYRGRKRGGAKAGEKHAHHVDQAVLAGGDQGGATVRLMLCRLARWHSVRARGGGDAARSRCATPDSRSKGDAC
jgi:hypothetical protein